jgi:phosphoribosyl 1,2-cyclic phosphate phosphodiesterase
MESHTIDNDEFIIGDIHGICFEQNHGFSKSLGIRIDNFAYSTDVVSLSNENFEKLQNLDTWIVGCQSLRDKKPTHAHLELVLEWVERIKPRQTFLTHMGATMDYETLLGILPENIRPAYDQMSIFLPPTTKDTVG